MGIYDVATQEGEKEVYALTPSAFEIHQNKIGADYRVKKILTEFNESNDFSDERIAQVKAQIQAIVPNNTHLGQLPYDVELIKVPEHVLPENSIMVPAESYTDPFDFYEARGDYMGEKVDYGYDEETVERMAEELMQKYYADHLEPVSYTHLTLPTN